MPKYLTVVPAYGRDYKTTGAALASWHANEDWLVSDFHDPADGKPINRADAVRDGLKVILRFDGHRKTADASQKPPKPRAKAAAPARARPRLAVVGRRSGPDICPARDGAQPHFFQDGRCTLCFAPASGRGSHDTKPRWGEVEWFSGDELLGRTPDARLYLEGRARGVQVGYQKKAKEFIGAHQDEDLLGKRFAFDRRGRVVMSNPSPLREVTRAEFEAAIRAHPEWIGKDVSTESRSFVRGGGMAAMQYTDGGKDLVAQAVYRGGQRPTYYLRREVAENPGKMLPVSVVNHGLDVRLVRGRWQPIWSETGKEARDSRLGINEDFGGYSSWRGAKEACVEMANAHRTMKGRQMDDDVRGNPAPRGPRLREGDLIRLDAHDPYAGLKAGQIGLVINMGGPGGSPDPNGLLVYAEWDNGEQTSTWRRSVVKVGRVTPRKITAPKFSTAAQERVAVLNDLRSQFQSWIAGGKKR